MWLPSKAGASQQTLAGNWDEWTDFSSGAFLPDDTSLDPMEPFLEPDDPVLLD